ncbi:MAG: exosortase-associated EpsI family protein [Phycisphaerales bacterium]
MNRRALLQPAFLVCFLTLGVSAAGLTAAVSAFKLYLRKKPIEAAYPVRAVPAETEFWKRIGKDREVSEDVKKTLGTENYLTRVYVERNPAPGKRARAIELHLAYYTGMVDTVPHVPERCMVGGGFVIDSGTVEVPVHLDTSRWRRASGVPGDFKSEHVVTAARLHLAGSNRNGQEVVLPFDLTIGDGAGEGVRDTVPLRVTDFIEPKSGVKIYAGYFFIANGKLASSAEDVRLLAFNLTDDYAYYLKVQVSSPEVSSAAELAEMSQSLLSELLPEIMLCVPDWVKVKGGSK